MSEARSGEIDRAAIDRAHLPLGRAERDPDQVRRDAGILRAPCVPL